VVGSGGRVECFKHRELEEKCDIVPDRLVEAIKLTTRKYVVPKVEPWELQIPILI
jgi:hypothetical protein